MAGNHQNAIANITIDIHLLVHERHTFVIQQIDFVQNDQRLDFQRFAGDEIAIDNIERKLG
ncbi:hypothetical protein D3C87_1600620 [compost metagenome]